MPLTYLLIFVCIERKIKEEIVQYRLNGGIKRMKSRWCDIGIKTSPKGRRRVTGP